MFRLLLALASAALACACASLPAPSALPPGGFELNGRIAVHYGNEALSGRIYWRHSDESDELLITSPLGQGIARIERSDARAELRTADGRDYRAADAESLTEAALGWRLPLAGLPDWVRGRASPGRPARLTRDEHDRVVELEQDGWRVEFQKYRGDLPSQLKISRAALEIRLSVDR